MTREHTRTAKDGLTLVEVVIAIALVAMLVAGVYRGITLTSNMTYATAQHLAAFTRCRESIEQMRAVEDYSMITESNLTAEAIQLAHMGGEKQLTLNATRSISIEDKTDPMRKEVTVTVAWDFKGRAMTEEATGVIYYKP